ncbi:hypothetical protein [Persephonella sp. KM09-Lau-8]|uniref:hypothetical protein n=1 Tax=Persephonella sp. KM09-Lau-8 TaxID=1158345 RepID=UPI000497E20D|nr:hypothetical protein [Persephonella sp. KM09-Lau-8]
MKKIKVLLILLMLINPAISQTKESKIREKIDKTNFDDAILDVCTGNPQLCKVVTNPKIYSFMKKNYKKALYTIAKIESGFRFKHGKRNKYDRGFFQINTKIWTPAKIEKHLGIKTTVWKITHNIQIQTEIALRIWIYNTAIYVLKNKKHPSNLTQYISLYHNPSKISLKYQKKVQKIIWSKL